MKWTIAILVTFPLLACTNYNLKAPSFGGREGLDQEQNPGIPIESDDPPISDPPVDELMLTVSGLPAEPSSNDQLELQIKASSEISKMAYQIGENCSKADAFIEFDPLKPLSIDVSGLDDGDVTLCFIAFLDSEKTWQTPENATTAQFKRLGWSRTIQTVFIDYDFECRKDLKYEAEINLKKSSGTFTWTLDRAAQGCQGESETGKGQLEDLTLDKMQAKGTWRRNKLRAGWFNFNWKNPEQSTFEGQYGFGGSGNYAREWKSE